MKEDMVKDFTNIGLSRKVEEEVNHTNYAGPILS
jgi:hypothetical protein